jgi:hypothetical protein
MSVKRSVFAGEKGRFGSERGPSSLVETPDRAPDMEVPPPILPHQDLLLRLCGDRDPLHSDPKIRCGGGLSEPDPAQPLHVWDRVQDDRGCIPGQ